MTSLAHRSRVARHNELRREDLTQDARAGMYTEVSDDWEWALRDERGDWGGDDSHNDMLAFCPTDAALIEWRCGPGRTRWLARAAAYARDTRNHYGREIRERAAELDARFMTFGRRTGSDVAEQPLASARAGRPK